jgi:hypothetical protein
VQELRRLLRHVWWAREADNYARVVDASPKESWLVRPLPKTNVVNVVVDGKHVAICKRVRFTSLNTGLSAKSEVDGRINRCRHVAIRVMHMAVVLTVVAHCVGGRMAHDCCAST